MSGVAAICLTSRLGSTRPSIAFGWELEIVTLGAASAWLAYARLLSPGAELRMESAALPVLANVDRLIAEIARRLMGLQRQRLAESQVVDRRTRRVLWP